MLLLLLRLRFLTNKGIEYLREYLNLPADVVPATLKKSARPAGEGRRPPMGGDRPPRGPPREGGYRWVQCTLDGIARIRFPCGLHCCIVGLPWLVTGPPAAHQGRAATGALSRRSNMCSSIHLSKRRWDPTESSASRNGLHTIECSVCVVAL
jgi:hypothetical protein